MSVGRSLFENRAYDDGLTNNEPLPEERKIEDEPPPLGDHGHEFSEPTTVDEVLARIAARQFTNGAALPEPRAKHPEAGSHAKIPEGNSAPLPEQRAAVPTEHMQKLSVATVAARFKVSPSMAPLFRPFVTPQRDKGRSLGQ